MTEKRVINAAEAILERVMTLYTTDLSKNRKQERQIASKIIELYDEIDGLDGVIWIMFDKLECGEPMGGIVRDVRRSLETMGWLDEDQKQDGREVCDEFLEVITELQNEPSSADQQDTVVVDLISATPVR